MQAELIPYDSNKYLVVTDEGDVCPAADFADANDSSETIAPTAEEQLEAYQATVDLIKRLLLRAHDASQEAKKPRIHQPTRDRLNLATEELRSDADALIAKTFVDPTLNEYDQKHLVVSYRARLREEAIQERQGRQRGVAMGHAAVYDPTVTNDERPRDWMECAANDK